MWGLGALRDGAAGLVKQGAGAVKHGVEAGAKLLENLDEAGEQRLYGESDSGSDYDDEEYEQQGDFLSDKRAAAAELEGKGAAPLMEEEEGAFEGSERGVGPAPALLEEPSAKGNMDDAFGLDPTSDEFQAVKLEMERLSRNFATQVEGKDRQIKKLRREVRRVRQEAEMAVNEMQPQLRNLVDVLQESKAEIAALEERLTVANGALQEETQARHADVEVLQALLRDERTEGDAEKEGLRQTVQMLQREIGDQNASLSEANQRLEQALARSAESEETSARLSREAEELRERLSTPALSDADAKIATNATEGDTTREAADVEGPARKDGETRDSAPASPAPAPAAGQGLPDVAELKRELEDAASKLAEESAGLRREQDRAVDLEKRLATSETLSQQLGREVQRLADENESWSGRLASAESAGEEAMKAATVEAARAAELREGFDNAEAELVGLRGRLAEWEEDLVRAAELKGTLEATRDALDELRISSGQSEATAERRVRELEVQMESEASARADLEMQLAAAAKDEADTASMLEANRTAAMEDAKAALASTESSNASLREDLAEALKRSEGAEQAAADAGVKAAEESAKLEKFMEEANDAVRGLEAELAVQKEALLQHASLGSTVEDLETERDALRAEVSHGEELAAELTARDEELRDLQARAEASEARAEALALTTGRISKGDDGDAAMAGEQAPPTAEIETALRAQFQSSLSGVRQELAESEAAREAAAEALARAEEALAEKAAARSELSAELEAQRLSSAAEAAERAGLVERLERDLAAAMDAAREAEQSAREANAARAAAEKEAAACTPEEAVPGEEAAAEAAAAAAIAAAVAGEASKREAAEKALAELEERAAAGRAELEEALRDAREEVEGSREAATEACAARAGIEEQAEIASSRMANEIQVLQRELAERDATAKAESVRTESALREAEELRVAMEGAGQEDAAEVAELRGRLEGATQDLTATEQALSTTRLEADDALALCASLKQELSATTQALGRAREAQEAASADARSSAAEAGAASSRMVEEVAALTDDLAASTSEVAALRHQIVAAESTIADMDAARAVAHEQTTALRSELAGAATAAESSVARALAAAREEHARAQESLGQELAGQWRAALEEAVEGERAASLVRVSEKAREAEALEAGILKAEAAHEQTRKNAAAGDKRAALALSDAEGAAQVAAWEAKSLREELETVRNRSRELSSALEGARASVGAANRQAEEGARGELDRLREAVRVAEEGRSGAEDGLSRMKEKRKRDLQEVRRLNERIMDLRTTLAAFETSDAEKEEALAKALREAEDLRQAATAAAEAAAAAAASTPTLTPPPQPPVNASQGEETGAEPNDAPPHSPPAAGADIERADEKDQQRRGGSVDGREEGEREVIKVDAQRAGSSNDGASGGAAAGGVEGRGLREDGGVGNEEREKELLLLRKVVEKLKREVEGLKSDLEEAAEGHRKADDARESLAAALGRANGRIAELTSKAAQLTRARAAMVTQVRALEEQANAAALNQTPVGSPAAFPPVREEAPEPSPPPAPLTSSDGSLGGGTPMRQRHRQSAGSADLEDGGARASLIRAQGDFLVEDEDNSQAKPGDHVKSLLIYCASNPLWAVVNERLPGITIWLHQQQPQTLWTAAMAYLGFLHLLVMYKAITC